MIRLLLKTYDNGKKYLCKREKDDYLTYRGSGKNITDDLVLVDTEVLFETEDSKLFKKTALYYSNLWSVDTNSSFLNIVKEEGQGGNTGINHPTRGINISKALKGKPKSLEARKNMSAVDRSGSKHSQYKTGLKIKVSFPDGSEELVTEGFSFWCKQRGLDPSAMNRVRSGELKQFKGHTEKDFTNA